MKLTSFRVTNYKSIEDSGTIRVEPITAFVGRNESGKTALFEALAKLNPVAPIDPEFNLDDFPRRRLNDYKKTHETKPAIAIEATFELTDEGMKSLEELFGEGAVTEREVAIEKRFNNTRYFSIGHDEALHVKHLVNTAGLPESIAKKLEKNANFRDLLAACRMLDNPAKSVQDFHYKLEQFHDQPLMKRIIQSLDIPTFFYFSDYSLMPGSISVADLKEAEAGRARMESHYTALALIQRVGAKLDDFLDLTNYEALKADLEDASNRISDEVYGYWSQQRDIELEIALQPVMDEDKRHIDTMLHLRVRNTRDRVSVPFDKRSRGFVWFFSFVVAFSQYRKEGHRVLLVLDEPGHSLHPRAQGDLLRYIENEVAPFHQVLYSTHSPFMIDTAKTERVRVVADGGDGKGTHVTEDSAELDPEANFTLRAALAFDLAEGLFEGINTLLVADPADVIWLRVISELQRSEGRKGLSEAWTVVPAGVTGRVAAYVSLLGMNRVNLGVFLPMPKTEQKRLKGLLKDKELNTEAMILPNDIVKGASTIADLFTLDTWLEMVSKAYSRELDGAKLSEEDLVGEGDNGSRVSRAFETLGIEGEFSLFRVASVLLRNPEVQALVDDKSLKNFEKAFDRLNELLDAED